MTSVITGDIISSRRAKEPEEWLKALKTIFNQVGTEPEVWQIFRGDSFQVEVSDVPAVLMTAIRLKAAIRSVKGLDVKMAIGIGSKNYAAPKITESNGEVFIRSGELFEQLKKHILAMHSPWPDVDREMNLCFQLALLTMDHWSVNSAQTVLLSTSKPGATQNELASILKITQGRISERQKRAGLEELLNMERHFRELISLKLEKP